MEKIINAKLLGNDANGRLHAEASDLGFAAGQWPTTLVITEDNNEVIRHFHRRMIQRDNDGDVTIVSYHDNDSGMTLEVFND